MHRPSASLIPGAGLSLRCWSGPARSLLIVAAVPLALRFVWAVPVDSPPPEPWPALAVDANTAPVPVLEALPGLGPALSGRIDQARTARPFRSLDDLDRRVKGIGPAKASGLRPFLRFPNPAERSPNRP